MANDTAPVVVRAGSTAEDAPVVVLLHGRGADENDLIGLADHLPQHLAYLAPRGRVSLPDGGYTWFENAGLGRPLPESLHGTIDWFTNWLAAELPTTRPVVLIGFSAGALFGGSLLFADTQRYRGFGLLMGALPLQSDFATSGRPWSGVPVLAVHADSDEVMPAELMTAAWQWVHEESGAEVTSQIVPGGHAIGSDTTELIRDWLGGLFPA